MRYDPKTGLLYKTQRAISGSMLALALDRENPPNGYVIFIVGELERDSRKYGNRGYRLIHLDAGHAAQNAYLFGAEQGLGILEYAGFRDENTAELLGINYPQEAVVIALIVGYEDKKTTVPQFSSVRLDYLHLLKQELVGPGKPVEWVQQIQFGISPYELKRAAAIASYRDTKPGSKPGAIHRRCQGISTSSVEAGIKAIAEAYERYVSGLVRWDQVATAEELSNRNNQWVDPRLYTPYTKEQYEGPFSHLKPFSTTETLQWVLGKRMATNESVYVPIELTFYPIDQVIVQRKTCYEASSNGVAAFPDEETATEKALLELIERDAICTMWYSKCPVTAIPQKNLDLDTRLRMRRWEELGWEVKCLNITRDSIPVVLCIIFSKKRRPHFVSGAAAAWTYKEAAQKAMDEAELMLTARKQSRRQRPNPKKVRSPLDHGILFFEYEMLATLDWLIEAKTEKIQERETPDLIKLFDPIKVNLTQNEGKGPLSVVRVLSQKLMPISFGYGTEHIDHPRMRMLGLKWNRSNPATPHFFA
jgi:thiazole/oxazole-forming peptide maturase SagD family component